MSEAAGLPALIASVRESITFDHEKKNNYSEWNSQGCQVRSCKILYKIALMQLQGEER